MFAGVDSGCRGECENCPEPEEVSGVVGLQDAGVAGHGLCLEQDFGDQGDEVTCHEGPAQHRGGDGLQSGARRVSPAPARVDTGTRTPS